MTLLLPRPSPRGSAPALRSSGQMDQKHKLLRKGISVLDLGCAPGGWLQYASAKINLNEGTGRLVGIDLLETEAIPGAVILKGDINDDAMLAALITHLDGQANLVLSDMAADTTGYPLHRSSAHHGPARHRA